ncbi:kinase-like domain-containing protein [Suillus lakei]|nr:kinase-like domain-containing protein [Suillus lakei]
MCAQQASSQAFPADIVSSYSMFNLDARHRHGSPRPAAQHRQHAYKISGREPSVQKLPNLPELIAHLSTMITAAGQSRVTQSGGESKQSLPQSASPTPSFGTSPGVDGPSTVDQRQSAVPLTHQSSPPQLIPPIHIPDLTGLITRCSQDPVCGGTYGNIYKCIFHGPDGRMEVAVKAFRPQFFSAELFRRELGIWKRLQHSKILKFMGTTSDFGSSVALVAPWLVNGTLTSFLNETLTLRDRLLLLRDIAEGLDYLHTFSFTAEGHVYFNPVVHGDLTGNNVLIDGDRKAYLADFGLSGTLTKVTGMSYLAKMSRPGAVRWTAPELLSEESASAITTQSDIYSFGNIMLQVLTGNVPWCHLTNETAILLKVIEGKIHPRPDDHRVTDQHWHFITRCWSKTPIDRPPAKEALQFLDRELTLLRLQAQDLPINGLKDVTCQPPQVPSRQCPSSRPLLELQDELDKSIAKLRSFAPNSPTSPSSSSSDFNHTEQPHQSSSTDMRTLSDFSLNDFPSLPWLASQAPSLPTPLLAVNLRLKEDRQARLRLRQNSILDALGLLLSSRIPATLADPPSSPCSDLMSDSPYQEDDSILLADTGRSYRPNSDGTQYEIISFIGNLTTSGGHTSPMEKPLDVSEENSLNLGVDESRDSRETSPHLPATPSRPLPFVAAGPFELSPSSTRHRLLQLSTQASPSSVPNPEDEASEPNLDTNLDSVVPLAQRWMRPLILPSMTITSPPRVQPWSINSSAPLSRGMAGLPLRPQPDTRF